MTYKLQLQEEEESEFLSQIKKCGHTGHLECTNAHQALDFAR